MKNHYDNGDRLSSVTDQDWRCALDELTAYLTWRLRGKTARGAHSERALGMDALTYYQEEAVIRLIEGSWKWQPRYTLGQQLVEIASNLITKQVEKWQREHPGSKSVELSDEGVESVESVEFFGRKSLDLIELRDPDMLPDVIDEDDSELIDDTYDVVYTLVEDDEELTIFVSAIEHCGNFKDLPEHTGWDIKHVYRLMEKLMRRIRSAKKNGLI